MVQFEFFTFALIQLYHREDNFFSLRRYTFITALIKKYQRTANVLIQNFADYQRVVHLCFYIIPVFFEKKTTETTKDNYNEEFCDAKEIPQIFQNSTNSFDKNELISTMIAKSCVKKRKVVFCCLSCFFLETLLF